ncbi:hypothetical protein Skr01_55850 [Sphaerisporangium krabiense]|uniref:Uncharacterized protein n=1 Tax=Sphaerisporangium krabiense TaxID=763782 RepID=A0A7W9DTH8_9ACTN|nr:hypothetical protein [Sphaerisporangium krabiense]MBB5630817.1 hypothetical protein [Sphaerisporangium krabiense]GII65500.1 hypothetical protein Skr01_55850 [Sphaerisporangium krabiense]
MTEHTTRPATHTITTRWQEIPEDADERALVEGGAFRAFACSCGAPLPARVAAELHAMETGQCSACLGSADRELVPGFVQRCAACAATGRRNVQLVWEVAHGEAAEVITTALVREVVAGFSGPFRLSQVADTVRESLGLARGRLPVGPRVRDVLRELEASGELVMLSAPDELLRGPAVVLYRDPLWQRAPLPPG